MSDDKKTGDKKTVTEERIDRTVTTERQPADRRPASGEGSADSREEAGDSADQSEGKRG